MPKDGSKYERELREWFYDSGAVALRIPSSGSATKRSLPDVLGRVGGYDFAIELKYSATDYARFTVNEANDLIEFAYLWGAVPCFVARFAYDTDYYVLTPETLPDQWVDKQTFSIPRDHRASHQTLSDLIADVIDDDTQARIGDETELIQAATP
jgi:Holliday junction resolvase